MIQKLIADSSGLKTISRQRLFKANFLISRKVSQCVFFNQYPIIPSPLDIFKMLS